jgi:GNAT superfamily N-acetyltransferase
MKIKVIKAKRDVSKQERDERGRWVTVHHGTTLDSLASILEKGIRPSAEGGVDGWAKGGLVYATHNKEAAKDWAYSRANIAWKNDPSKKWADYTMAVVTIKIPADKLKLLKTDSNNPEGDSGAITYPERIPAEWIVGAETMSLGESWDGKEDWTKVKAASKEVHVVIILPSDKGDDRDTKANRDVSKQERDELGRWTRVGRGRVTPKSRKRKGGLKLTAEAKELLAMSGRKIEGLSSSDIERLTNSLVGNRVEVSEGEYGLLDTQAFIKALGITPKDLQEKLSSEIGESEKLHLSISTRDARFGGGGLYLTVEGRSFYAERSFYSRGNTVYHDVFQVNERARGKGIASTLNLAMLDIYDNAGINKIGIASAEVGSYAWLRCGFVPNSVNVPTIRGECKDRIEELNETDAYSAQVTKAKSLLEQVKSDPKAFIAVAALRDVIKHPYTGKRMSLGYYLLQDTGWEGSLDLNDKLRYSIYRGYLESKKGEKSADEREEWDDEFTEEVQSYLDALIAKEFPSLIDTDSQTTRSGQKYNPDWYLQPRRRGQWSTVALKREEKGHLSDWGTGETKVNLSMNKVDKRYLEMGFGMKAENLAEFLHKSVAPALPEGAVPQMEAAYYPSMTDNSMVTVMRMDHMASGFVSTLKVYNYLDGSPPKFEVAYLRLPSNEQSKGVGKDILKSYMDLADNVGADRIALLANIDLGGYAWARYGFVPTPESWKALSVSVRKNLSQCAFSDASLANQVSGHIKTLTSPSSDPRNIRALAALTVEVDHPKLGKTKLGLALLKGTDWDSLAYLNDKEVMAHLKATCSKEESFGSDDWSNVIAVKPQNKNSNSERGVFFTATNTGKSDYEIHQAMLPAGSFVADQVAIRQLMSIGLSRADARRFISVQRGYGG